MTRKYLGIDTSVLSAIQRDKSYKNDFEQWVARSNFVVLIPNAASKEFCFRTNPKERKCAAVWLKSYIEGSSVKIVFGKNWLSLLRKEKRCVFTRPQLLSGHQIKKTLAGLENLNIPQEIVESHQKGKQIFLNADSGVSKKINDPNQKVIGLDETRKLFEAYCRLRPETPILSIIRHVASIQPQQLIIYTSRYRTAYVTALLFDYYTLGLTIPAEVKKGNQMVYMGSGKEKNSHEDHKIVGECAYCDYFLTEDKNLNIRCSKLSHLLPIKICLPLK